MLADSLKVFISYSHDSIEHNKHVRELSDLLRAGGIDCILDQYVESPPEGWPYWMEEQLRLADYVLIICTSTYKQRAMRKEDEGKGLGVLWESTLTYQYLFDEGTINQRFIPVLLEHSSVEDIPMPLRGVTHYSLPVDGVKLYSRLTDQRLTPKPELGKIRKLPNSLRDITLPLGEIVGDDYVITEEIRNTRVLNSNQGLLEKPSGKSKQLTLPSFLTQKEICDLDDVFVRSGVPEITFVEHNAFTPLKKALTQRGRGIVVEGPSGVGKTTAVLKAVMQRKIRNYRYFSALDEDDIHQILTLLRDRDREGIIIIDDFHRLFKRNQAKLSYYLKALADARDHSKKLVIIGIPQTSQALVDTAFDTATRFDPFKMGFVKPRLILPMIELGEEALNIEFEGKDDIANAAHGSLNMAQYLCYNICYNQHLEQTQAKLTKVRFDIDKEVSRIMEDVLKRKFGKMVEYFVGLGGFEDDAFLKLLKLLAKSEDGVLYLVALKANRSDLSKSIDYIINNHVEIFKFQNSENFIYYNDINRSLVIDDPQLSFYLNNLKFSKLARRKGRYDDSID